MDVVGKVVGEWLRVAEAIAESFILANSRDIPEIDLFEPQSRCGPFPCSAKLVH